ncbi:hypothetical protein QFZ40_004366 [Arthrobacter pascens]|nr:hypothetical protein [Arthrobacter pascens]
MCRLLRPKTGRGTTITNWPIAILSVVSSSLAMSGKP